MNTTKIIDYIKKSKEAGVSTEVITQSLIAAGWSEQYVEKAFKQVDKSRNNFKTAVVLFALFIGTLSIFTSAIVVKLLLTKKDISTDKKAEKVTQDISIMKPPHNTIVFIKNDGTEHVVFYDASLKKELPSFKEFELASDKQAIELGNWSPNGKLLPIVVVNTHGSGNFSDIAMYFYDGTNHTIAEVYNSDKIVNKDYLFEGLKGYSSAWVSSTKFAYNISNDPLSTMATIYWTDTQGSLGKKTVTNKEFLIMADNYSISSFEDEEHKSYKYIHLPDKQMRMPKDVVELGVIDDNLIVHTLPTFGNVANPSLPNYIDTSKLVEELKAQGKSDEEIGRAVIDLAEPTEKTKLQWFDIATGNLTKEVELDNSKGVVESMMLLPNKKNLLIHETNKSFLPTESAYFVTDLQGHRIGKPLATITTDPRKNGYASKRLDTGISFDYLTLNNGAIFITYFANNDSIDWGSGIKVHYLESHDEQIICDKNCYDIKISSPYYESWLIKA